MDQQTNRATSIRIRFASSAASGHPHDGREPSLAGNDPSVTGHFLSALTDQIRFWESDQRNAPCRRRAFVHDACTVQFPPANPAAAYRSRIALLDSTFGIGPSVRISHRTAEPCHRVLITRRSRPVAQPIGARMSFVVNRRFASLPTV